MISVEFSPENVDPVIQLPEDLSAYVAAVLIASALIRVALATIRSVEFHYPGADRNGRRNLRSLENSRHGLMWNLIRDVLGTHPEMAQRDWLQTFLVGTMELLAFPLLIHAGFWEAIGGWVALKSVPHWKLWLSQGESYLRFFIGNGLVILASGYLAQIFLMATPSIHH